MRESSSGLRGGNKRVMTCDFNPKLALKSEKMIVKMSKLNNKIEILFINC